MFKKLLLTGDVVEELTLGEKLDKFFVTLKDNWVLAVTVVIVVILAILVGKMYFSARKRPKRR